MLAYSLRRWAQTASYEEAPFRFRSEIEKVAGFDFNVSQASGEGCEAG